METKEPAERIMENLKSRFSCRVFRDEPVTQEAVEMLLEAANCAPSPMNTQPWEFIVLTGEPLGNFRLAVGEWLIWKAPS